MKIAVVIRQVPDLIEPLQIGESGTSLDLDGATFLVNESDDHALEQALLLKEAIGGMVTVIALDFGDVDNTLYTAVAKGADQIIKIPYEHDQPPSTRQAAAIYAQAIKGLEPDLVLIGVSAHNELEGVLAPLLALSLDVPYVGVVRGVKPGEDGASVRAFKEFPGAVMAQMNARLPVVLGILAADQPPRYVPVSRIRAAMKSAQFREQTVAAAAMESLAAIRRLYSPKVGERAQILEGSHQEVAKRLAEILVEKGVVK